MRRTVDLGKRLEREEYRQFLVEQGIIPDRKKSPAGDAGQQLELFGDKFTFKQEHDTDEDHVDTGGNHNVV